jgi:hypothetical protein
MGDCAAAGLAHAATIITIEHRIIASLFDVRRGAYRFI